MKRREFIAGLAGAAAWPLAARAQQAERMRRIGVLWALSRTMHEHMRAFWLSDGPSKAWMVEGHNLRIDHPLGDSTPKDCTSSRQN